MSASINEIPLSELLEDRAASQLDLKTCEKLYASIDKTDVDGPQLLRRMNDRIIGNKAIIREIDKELERRVVKV